MGVHFADATTHQRLLGEGVHAELSEPIRLYGAVYNKVVYEKRVQMNCIEKTGRLFLLTLSSLLCYPCCSQECREQYYTYPVQGAVRREGLLKNEALTQELAEKDSKALGFNVQDRDSAREYAQRPENQKKLKKAHGHQYLPIFCPVSGFSKYILIPEGDFSKTRIKISWDPHTGKPHTMTAKVHEIGQLICASYDPADEDPETTKIVRFEKDNVGILGVRVTYVQNE